MTLEINQILQRQEKEQTAQKAAKRAAACVVVAGLGGAITFGAIMLPRSPDGVGLFVGAVMALTGVAGAFINCVRVIRRLGKSSSKPKL